MVRKAKYAAIVYLIANAASADPLQLTVVKGVNLTPLDTAEMACMQEALYFEARNQSYDGNLAVGYVILNRMRSPDFPDTVCGVVHQGGIDGSEPKFNRCQFSYYCDGKSDEPPTENYLEILAWETASIYAESVLRGDITEDPTNGSTYYHADYVEPNWASAYDLVAYVDSHKFYVHHTQ